MPAGVPKFVTVNVGQLEAACHAGEVVDLASLAPLVEASGARGRLPLKVLGEGVLTKRLIVQAGAFSASAVEKIVAAGGEATVQQFRKVWTRKAHEARVKAEAEGKSAKEE